MSRNAQVEFVCYQEGGVIDLERSLDDLLEPTLGQFLALPPIIEPESVFEAKILTGEIPFQPMLRPVALHRAAEDVLPTTFLRASSFRNQPASSDSWWEPSESAVVTREPAAASFHRILDRLPANREIMPRPSIATRTTLPEIDRRNLPACQPRPAAISSERSFHDLLATRSSYSADGRRSISLSRFSRRSTFAVWLLGEVTLFAGGGAMAAGFIGLIREESLAGRSVVIIASGAALISLSGLIRILKRYKWKPELATLKAGTS